MSFFEEVLILKNVPKLAKKKSKVGAKSISKIKKVQASLKS